MTTHDDGLAAVPVAGWLANVEAPELVVLLGGAVEAFEHPYGFGVVRLEDAAVPGWQIRLHIWPPKGTQLTRMTKAVRRQQVHAHGWAIWSRVFTGALEESSYMVRDSGDLDIFSVSSTYGVGASVLCREVQGISVTLGQRLTREPGPVPYLIPKGRFHSTVSAAEDGWSLSVVATELVEPRVSQVVAPSASTPSENARLEMRDWERLLQLLSAPLPTDVPNV